MKLTLIGGASDYNARRKLADVLSGRQYHSYDLEELDGITQISELSGGVGLFSQKSAQLVLLRGPFSAGTFLRKELEKFLEEQKDPQIGDLELVLFQLGNLDKRTSLYKTAKKSYQVYEYGKELPADKKELIRQILKEGGIETPPTILQDLSVRLEGFNMLTIANEMQKLLALAKFEGRGHLQASNLEIIPKPLDQEIWELLELAVKDKKAAYDLLAELLRQRVTIQLVIGFLASQLRSMLLIDIGLSTLPPFLRRKYSKLLARLGNRKLGFLIRKLADLDLAIKSGKLMPEAGVKLFIALI